MNARVISPRFFHHDLHDKKRVQWDSRPTTPVGGITPCFTGMKFTYFCPIVSTGISQNLFTPIFAYRINAGDNIQNIGGLIPQDVNLRVCGDSINRFTLRHFTVPGQVPVRLPDTGVNPRPRAIHSSFFAASESRCFSPFVGIFLSGWGTTWGSGGVAWALKRTHFSPSWLRNISIEPAKEHIFSKYRSAVWAETPAYSAPATFSSLYTTTPNSLTILYTYFLNLGSHSMFFTISPDIILTPSLSPSLSLSLKVLGDTKFLSPPGRMDDAAFFERFPGPRRGPFALLHRPQAGAQFEPSEGLYSGSPFR